MRGRLTAESPSQTEARKRHFIACDERRPRSPVAGLITAKRCHQILMDSSSKSSPFGINAVTISRSEGSPGSRTASRATISRRETARSSTPVIASSRPGPDTLARPKAISVAPQPSVGALQRRLLVMPSSWRSLRKLVSTRQRRPTCPGSTWRLPCWYRSVARMPAAHSRRNGR